MLLESTQIQINFQLCARKYYGVSGKKHCTSILMFAVLFSVPKPVLRCPDFISDVYFVIWFVVDGERYRLTGSQSSV